MCANTAPYTAEQRYYTTLHGTPSHTPHTTTHTHTHVQLPWKQPSFFFALPSFLPPSLPPSLSLPLPHPLTDSPSLPPTLTRVIHLPTLPDTAKTHTLNIRDHIGHIFLDGSDNIHSPTSKPDKYSPFPGAASQVAPRLTPSQYHHTHAQHLQFNILNHSHTHSHTLTPTHSLPHTRFARTLASHTRFARALARALARSRARSVTSTGCRRNWKSRHRTSRCTSRRTRCRRNAMTSLWKVTTMGNTT